MRSIDDSWLLLSRSRSDMIRLGSAGGKFEKRPATMSTSQWTMDLTMRTMKTTTMTKIRASTAMMRQRLGIEMYLMDMMIDLSSHISCIGFVG